MKEPKEDDERLSALLEGRVEGRQREELLAHLSAADDDYEVFTDTAAVLRALEEEDARRPVPPPSMRRGGWRLRTALAVTGTLVLLLAVGLVFRSRAASGADLLQLAMSANPGSGGLPEEWAIPAASGAVRGRRAGAERSAQAVKAGAMLVDLSVAARGGDTIRTGDLAAQLDYMVDRRAIAGTPLRRIEANPGAPAGSLDTLLQQAAVRLATNLEPEWLELGAWIEAARLAANAQNADFFMDGASGGMLRRAKRLAGNNEAARAAVARIGTALRVDGTPPWDMLQNDLTALLSEISA